MAVVDGPLIAVSPVVARKVAAILALGAQEFRSRNGASVHPDISAFLSDLRQVAERSAVTPTAQPCATSATDRRGSGACVYLTTKQAAERLGISEQAMRKARECGRIPGRRSGRRWRFATVDVEAMREARQ